MRGEIGKLEIEILQVKIVCQNIYRVFCYLPKPGRNQLKFPIKKPDISSETEMQENLGKANPEIMEGRVTKKKISFKISTFDSVASVELIIFLFYLQIDFTQTLISLESPLMGSDPFWAAWDSRFFCLSSIQVAAAV